MIKYLPILISGTKQHSDEERKDGDLLPSDAVHMYLNTQI